MKTTVTKLAQALASDAATLINDGSIRMAQIKTAKKDGRLALLARVMRMVDSGYSYQYNYSVEADVNLEVDKLKGNRRLRRILETIDNAGDVDWRTSDYVSEYTASRTYRAMLPGLTINVSARLTGEGKNCEKVVTGVKTETITRKVYAIKCD